MEDTGLMETRFAPACSVRSRVLALVAAFAVLFALVLPSGGLAQDQPPVEEGDLAEVPSFGGARPGPILPIFTGVPRGIAPIQLQIDKAGIDAPVERGLILDGVMQDPSGPWVVTWYDELSELGQGTNVVMAGHVDYWDVGPAVFWGVPESGRGGRHPRRRRGRRDLRVPGGVDRLYNVAQELTPEVIQNRDRRRHRQGEPDPDHLRRRLQLRHRRVHLAGDRASEQDLGPSGTVADHRSIHPVPVDVSHSAAPTRTVAPDVAELLSEAKIGPATAPGKTCRRRHERRRRQRRHRPGHARARLPRRRHQPAPLLARRRRSTAPTPAAASRRWTTPG